MTRVYQKRPTNCLGCHEKIRPREKPHLPGKPHAGNGYCNGCRSQWRRGVLGNKPPAAITPAITPAVHANNIAGLNHYIQRRRARGIPVQGLQAA